MISNQLVISKENHAARVAFSETALVRNHDDRHGERFVELSNEVRDFRAGLLSKLPGVLRPAKLAAARRRKVRQGDVAISHSNLRHSNACRDNY
jgi:hypothetical protein